jgi:hypothetical protein
VSSRVALPRYFGETIYARDIGMAIMQMKKVRKARLRLNRVVRISFKVTSG